MQKKSSLSWPEVIGVKPTVEIKERQTRSVDPAELEVSSGLRQRNPEATLTQEGEQRNVNSIQGVVDDLFANKDKMRAACKAQLGSLFNNTSNSYGRARAVGMTAQEASGLVNRAFSKQ